MSISSVSSVSSYARNSIEIPWEKEMRDFQALALAIQSGNIVNIMRAYTAWQQDQRTAATQPQTQGKAAAANAQANPALQALSTAVKSGDVSSAKTAFARLQKTKQGANAGSNGAGSNNGKNAAPVLGSASSGSSVGSLFGPTTPAFSFEPSGANGSSVSTSPSSSAEITQPDSTQLTAPASPTPSASESNLDSLA